MKPYGLKRSDTPGRKISGTQRPCPCCIPTGSHHDQDRQKHARQEGEAETQKAVVEYEEYRPYEFWDFDYMDWDDDEPVAYGDPEPLKVPFLMGARVR